MSLPRLVWIVEPRRREVAAQIAITPVLTVTAEGKQRGQRHLISQTSYHVPSSHLFLSGIRLDQSGRRRDGTDTATCQ